MLSFITCPRSQQHLDALQANLQQVLAIPSAPPAELVFETDPACLAAAWNRAIARAKGDTLIFLHDDIAFLSTDALPHLLRHLETFDVVGILGTASLTSGYLLDAGPPFLYGQILHPLPPGSPGPLAVTLHSAPARAIGNIAALDDCLLAFRRPLIEKLRFDETTFPAFDLAGIDASVRARAAGATLAVACDIPLFHPTAATPPGHRRPAWHAAVAAFNARHRLTPAHTLFQSALLPVPTVAAALEVMRPAFWPPA